MVLIPPVPGYCLPFTSHKQDVTSKVPLLVVGSVSFPIFLTIFVFSLPSCMQQLLRSIKPSKDARPVVTDFCVSCV